MDKRKRFLIIYGIVILVILIYILFLAPTNMFLSKQSKELINETNTKTYKDINEQLDNLNNSNYEYEYNLLDSIGSKSINYVCNGKVVNESEEGTCSKPKNITYNKDNKNNKLKEANTDILDINYIIELVKDKEYNVKEYDGVRKVTYSNVEIDKLDTDIDIYTNYNDVEQIQINNGYITYVMKYSIIDEE